MLHGVCNGDVTAAKSSTQFLWITLCVTAMRFTDVLDIKGFFPAARKSGMAKFSMKSNT